MQLHLSAAVHTAFIEGLYLIEWLSRVNSLNYAKGKTNIRSPASRWKECCYSDVSQQTSRRKCSKMFTYMLLVIAKPLEATQQSKNRELGRKNSPATECNTIEALGRMSF